MHAAKVVPLKTEKPKPLTKWAAPEDQPYRKELKRRFGDAENKWQAGIKAMRSRGL